MEKAIVSAKVKKERKPRLKEALIKQLEERRREVSSELEKCRLELSMTPDHTDNGSGYHMADKCFVETSRAPTQVDRLTKELFDIEDALQRIKEGETFNKCEKCGENISPERLEAVPWAKFCVNCQLQKECSGVDKRGKSLLVPRLVPSGLINNPEKLRRFLQNL